MTALADQPAVRRCVHCGDVIPGALRAGTKYCSRRCSQRRNPTRKRQRTVNLVELGAALRTLERQVIADFHARRAD